MKKLEENLLETRMLYTTALQDFEIVRRINGLIHVYVHGPLCAHACI